MVKSKKIIVLLSSILIILISINYIQFDNSKTTRVKS